MKKISGFRFLLILIVSLGLFLRFVALGDNPSGFHADEAAYGYNAYSIIQTGKDEYGKSFPIVLKSFGDYKPAIYSYIDVPFVYLFGLTPFAVRFPSALFGSLTVLLIYFLALNLTASRKVAIISAFLLAISPWHLALSRTTSEVVISLFFIMLMSYALLTLEKRFSRLWMFVALLSGVFAIGTYTASRFFVVIISFLFFAFSVYKKRKYSAKNKYALYVMITLLVFGIIYSTIASVSRFSQISIFTDSETKLVLEEQIREDEGTHVMVTRFFHNKLVNYSRTTLGNFGQYFTLDFLFLNGGAPQRLAVPNAGLFYFWTAPFLLIGIYQAVRRRNRYLSLLLAWWVLTLIPVAFTFDESPNLYRAAVTIPPILILSALGIYEFFNYIKVKRFAKFILAAVILVGIYEFLYFHHQYFVHQNLHRPWYRGFAYKALVKDLNKFLPSYEKVLITKSKSSPYIYILFYDKFSPKRYQEIGSPRDLDHRGIDKYYFASHDCPLNAGINGEDLPQGDKSILYVNNGNCLVPKNARLLSDIYWEDGTIAFRIVEFVGEPVR
ncbi:MAG: glycosyltransferase family 39 protein [Candidatus Levyibacteriota bacterium]